MEDRTVLIERKGQIAYLILNRPDALNTLNEDLAKSLRSATSALEFDEGIRCVVLKGTGSHFAAGGDIKFFKSLLEQGSKERQSKIHELIQDVHSSIVSLRRMQKPVLASIEGAVAGFGISLVCACDLAIASKNSYFTLAYTHLGLSPDGGATFALPRLVGLKKAAELLFLNERFLADKAKDYGLVNWVVEETELAFKTDEIALKLAQGATYAFSHTKQLLNEAYDAPLLKHLEKEEAAFLDCATSDDFKEGIQSFLTKKAPHFKGE
jgi:2-(1,2-epoxy-1,2-dihydrophenyl)acetyl-CoA isomerase